ncbi:hypothetical protein PR202_ga24030 [Eleusine coracana subsp. coracana]|uniref:Serine-threonine/tyrosine-protein kinase catalytic domain-containing protein n=1 Tax=Eleusine coracana subsp. coracana TaxID=191504 RepID=A0AAV5D5S2_ELECO|nr:hypothetical protein PR202_ga24030 [Eleusine coracana subsp. coracana]
MHDSNTKFSAEVDCLKKVKHRNIVGLLGYCDETRDVVVQYKGKKVPTKQQERLLCFEYVSKGSLQDHIKGRMHLYYSSSSINEMICSSPVYSRKKKDAFLFCNFFS